MRTKHKITPYRYIIGLLLFLFLNGAIYSVDSVLLKNQSQQLQSAQVKLNIVLPEVIRQVSVDGIKSLQWLTLSSDPALQAGTQVVGVADHYPEPLPPTHLFLTNTKIGQSVIIRWQPANGQTLTGVEIYRSSVAPAKPLQDMELIATVAQAEAEYIDEAVTDNETYYYAVRAYRALAADAVAIQYSAMTDIYTVIPTDETAPRGPRWAQVTQPNSQTETGLTLSWEPLVDADATELRIYRSTEPGALGTEIKSVTPDVTELVDTTVEAAVNYYYTITAVDAAGNESSRTLYISRSGNTAPFVLTEQEASERIHNGN